MATQDKILASAIQLDFNSVTGLEIKHVHLNDVNDFLTLVARIRRNDFAVTAEVFDNEQTVKIHMTDLVSRDAIHIAITADAYEFFKAILFVYKHHAINIEILNPENEGAGTLPQRTGSIENENRNE